jgi:hypothetical protein
MQSIKAKKRNAIDQRLMSQIKSNLAWNPKKAKNYDISGFDYILPIGLSALKRILCHQQAKKILDKWSYSERVLTIEEFKLLDNKIIQKNNYKLNQNKKPSW